MIIGDIQMNLKDKVPNPNGPLLPFLFQKHSVAKFGLFSNYKPAQMLPRKMQQDFVLEKMIK